MNSQIVAEQQLQLTNLHDGVELLARARTQWQAGEWDSLAALNKQTLQNHPDRAKLALFAAAACLQTQRIDEGTEFLRFAQIWGASKKQMSQILIASVYNCLGRAYLAKGDDSTALRLFEESIGIVQANADSRLAGEARAVREATHLGLLPQAADFLKSQLHNVKSSHVDEQARIKILETELELLHHELSLAQQRQQLFAPKSGESAKGPELGSDEWKTWLKNKSLSQLGQDLWVLEKTGYKRGGYFVEFGATDGVLLSNTWLLEKEFGWNGICAEPNPKFFEKLNKNRHCTLSNQCISGITGKVVDFIYADAYGGSQEYADSDMHKDKRQAYSALNKMAQLPTISLHDFLIQHGAPKDIDYLSIDTEGSELEIISAFPFEMWNIKLLTIEHNFTVQRENIKKILEGFGYIRIEAEWDDWYEKSI